MQFVRKLSNYFLIKKYPFLLCRNRWNGQTLKDKYSFTELDDMPEGWRKAFGKKLCKDIKCLFVSSGHKDFIEKYRIVQIKEKYGQLRWYDNRGSRRYSKRNGFNIKFLHRIK